MNCVSDASGNGTDTNTIAWTYDGNTVVSEPCTNNTKVFIGEPDGSKGPQCGIRAYMDEALNDTTIRYISGPYGCTDQTNEGVTETSTVIVLGNFILLSPLSPTTIIIIIIIIISRRILILYPQKQKHNVSTNIITPKGVFPEGHTTIVLDTRSNAENDHQILLLAGALSIGEAKKIAFFRPIPPLISKTIQDWSTRINKSKS